MPTIGIASQKSRNELRKKHGIDMEVSMTKYFFMVLLEALKKYPFNYCQQIT